MIACRATSTRGNPPFTRVLRTNDPLVLLMPDSAPANDSSPPRAALGRWLIPALAFLATIVVLLRTRDIGLMGFDSYPLILTARIESWADFLGTFSESLMDGRYSGDYFRPLLNLSFALDHALWGIDAFGYQLTGALLFGATGWALGSLLQRLLGESARAGVFVGLAFFLLHDSHFEVIPVPARRPELLCALFACLALTCQLKPRALAARWSPRPAVWMLLAAASKETGYALPAVAVVAVFLYSPQGSARERVAHALRVGLTHAALIGALLALRLAVLGGLGGPAPPAAGVDHTNPLELTRVLLVRLFVPQNVEHWGGLVPALASLCVLVFVAAWFVARGSKPGSTVADAQSGESSGEPLQSTYRSALVSLAWISLVALLYGVSRSIAQWYLFLPVVGLALLVGSAAQLAAILLRKPAPFKRAIGAASALCLACFALCQVRYTPLLHDYPEWRAASSASDEFFARLGRRIERSAPGEVIKAPPIPVWYPAPQTGPAIRGAAIVDDYSVQAWLELVHPEREFRVLKAPPSTPLPPTTSVVQLLRPLVFPR